MKKSILLLLALALFCLPVPAQTVRNGKKTEKVNATTAAKPAMQRPKVAVVLSGGGAKGMAHIGVLKYLEELGIPVDIVVGTSIGSIVGGLYSLGYSADQLDSLVQAQDWDFLISDRYKRSMLTYREKKEGEQYLVSIPFKNAESFSEGFENKQEKSITQTILGNIPSALVEGQNLYNLFTSLSVGYQDSVDFNLFPIRFACVAVDMNGKKEYVFHNGNFARAIRASMAIPAYFAPVQYNGMYLVDGGVLNNFPVDVAREMGADIVIGSELHFKKSIKPHPVNNLIDEVNGMMSLLEMNKYQQNVKDVDVLITPEVDMYGTLDFTPKSLAALRDSGYNAAVTKKYDLEELASSLRKMQDIDKKYTNGPMRLSAPKAINLDTDSVYVADIEVKGVDPADAEWLIKKTKLLDDNKIAGKDIEEAIRTFYRTGAYQYVTYTLNGNEEPYHMVINLIPGQLHQFNFGFRFDSEETAAMLLNVSFNRLKLYGQKLDLTARLSYNPYFKVQGSYTFRNLTQVNASAIYRYSNVNIYDCRILASHIKQTYARGELSIQTHSLKRLMILGGTRFEYYRLVGPLDAQYSWMPNYYNLTDNDKYYYASAFADFSFDNRDKGYFPTRGGSFFAEYSYYPDLLMKSTFDYSPFQSFMLNWQQVMPLGRKVALIWQLYASAAMPFSISLADDSGAASNFVPVTHMNIMGGYQEGRYTRQQMPFVGVNNAVVMKRLLVIPRVDLRLNIAKSHYITLMANYAQSSDFYTDFLNDLGNYGFGLGYSYDSFLGPISLNLHYSDLQKFGVYFNLGYYF